MVTPVTVAVYEIRPLWIKARRSYAATWTLPEFINRSNKLAVSQQFFKDFSRDNDLILDMEPSPLSWAPHIKSITFKSEEAYTWFILKWG